MAHVKALKEADYATPPPNRGETAGGKDSLSHNSDVKYARVPNPGKKITMG
jgi:hypothetical protein